MPGPMFSMACHNCPSGFRERALLSFALQYGQLLLNTPWPRLQFLTELS